MSDTGTSANSSARVNSSSTVTQERYHGVGSETVSSSEDEGDVTDNKGSIDTANSSSDRKFSISLVGSKTSLPFQGPPCIMLNVGFPSYVYALIPDHNECMVGPKTMDNCFQSLAPRSCPLSRLNKGMEHPNSEKTNGTFDEFCC